MTQPARYTLTITADLPALNGYPAYTQTETFEGLTADELAAAIRGRVAMWRYTGLSVREGDGWATGVSAVAMFRLTADRMLPGEPPAWEPGAGFDPIGYEDAEQAYITAALERGAEED